MRITGLECLLMLAAYFGLCSCSRTVTVSVYNPSAAPRPSAVVEIDASAVTNRLGSDFSVSDERGVPVVSQLTYDNKILIEGELGGKERRKYVFRKADGPKLSPDTVCVGQIRHDKQDDFAWENDRSGYRLYGPSYREKGGNVSGYDIWTKSVPYPVLEARYDDHQFIKASYHKDHGSGMDVYTVGRTLGAGMNSLVADGGEPAYPCAYEKCDIIESGPLRMTARITCYPEAIGSDSGVVETRLITLDKGSWLNRTDVSYEGLRQERPLINGIVVHRQNPKGYILDGRKRFLAYADLTDNPANGNGVIFIGVVNPELPSGVEYVPLDPEAGDAIGHIVSKTTYRPGNTYTYYWGSGWSKGGVKGMKAWAKYLADYHDALSHPLEVTIR